MSAEKSGRSKRSQLSERLRESLAEMEAFARGEALPAATHEVSFITSREVEIVAPKPMTGKEILELRARIGVSQTVFARLLNVSVSLVRARERDARTADGARQTVPRYPQRYPYLRIFLPRGAALFRVFTLSGLFSLWR